VYVEDILHPDRQPKTLGSLLWMRKALDKLVCFLLQALKASRFGQKSLQARLKLIKASLQPIQVIQDRRNIDAQIGGQFREQSLGG
jgi:hypothetical protein